MDWVNTDRLRSSVSNHPVVVSAGVLLFIAATIMGPARLLGLAKTQYYHSNDSMVLRTKSGQKVTLAELCKSVIPPCRLNPFLFNGHLQTMWTVVKGGDIPICYKRRIFEHQNPTYTGSFSVDFVVSANKDHDTNLPPRTTYWTNAEFEEYHSDDTKPMLVVLHGLSGGSHELYLRSVLAPLVGDGGWEACVVNSRGCSMTKITSTVLYNARATWDIKQTVEMLSKRFPNRPLFGCGFSMGASIITNYIGEEGDKCLFKAACVLSSPWNLEAGSLALQRTWFRREVYSRTLAKNMKNLFEIHFDQVSKNPDIDVKKVRSLNYLHEFDRYVQGPTWGYPSEGAYYRDASSIDVYLGVRIPFLAIHADDDPVAAGEAIPRQEIQVTPYGVLCVTDIGGHLSWFELGGGRWFARATTAFFQKMACDMDLNGKFDAGGPSLVGTISREQRPPLKPIFDPARRKLHIPGQ